MCVYSAIFDHYTPKFPVPSPTPYELAVPWLPVVPDAAAMTPEELLKLIEDFKKAAEDAKEQDKKEGNPDCEDPDKARLLERIEILEHRIEILELSKTPKKKVAKKRKKSAAEKKL